jgi:hypothetical protein
VNCPFCNYPNDHNAPFCVNCGAVLPSEKRPSQRSAQPPSSAGPQWTQQPPAPQATPAPGPPPQTRPGTSPYQAGQPPQQAPYPPQPQGAAQDWQALYTQGRAQPLTQAAAPAKKGSKGCIVAAIVVGALVLVIGCVAAAVLYFAYARSRALALEQKRTAELQAQATMEQMKKEIAKGQSGQPKKTEVEASSEERVDVNPLVQSTPLADLFQSQIFKQNDRIPYAGLTFSIKKDILLYKPAMLPEGVKAGKGTWMADVSVQVEGNAKMKKFRLTLIDGAGARLKPDGAFEKYMSLPGGSGETHKLWKKVSKISGGSPAVLHKGFSVDGKNAHDFLVEIKNLNIDRALWIQAGHAMASR